MMVPKLLPPSFCMSAAVSVVLEPAFFSIFGELTTITSSVCPIFAAELSGFFPLSALLPVVLSAAMLFSATPVKMLVRRILFKFLLINIMILCYKGCSGQRRWGKHGVLVANVCKGNARCRITLIIMWK